MISRALERSGLWLVPVVIGGAAAAGVLVSPGAGTLVVVGALLLVVLAVGFMAVEALLSSDAGSPAAEVQEGEIATLRREKASVLQVLRDLEVERDLGKVSAGDFEVLDRKFRGRAIELMKRIDSDLAVYRKKAEALIADRLTGAPAAAEPDPVPPPAVRSCPACQAAADLDTVFCKKCGRRLACEKCAAALDADSLFCKKCGTRVEANA